MAVRARGTRKNLNYSTQYHNPIMTDSSVLGKHHHPSYVIIVTLGFARAISMRRLYVALCLYYNK